MGNQPWFGAFSGCDHDLARILLALVNRALLDLQISLTICGFVVVDFQASGTI
jgi:hypothetical protein